MIKNQNRSKWFGASDTHFIMGNWNTITFVKWWCVKLGLTKNEFQTKYTLAGTHYEHKIAKAIENEFQTKLKLDRQLKIRKLRLRVNLDSENKDTVFEIKTFRDKGEEWQLPKHYIMQVYVQMWTTGKKGTIVAYPMTEEYYKNYFLEIDKSKLLKFEIQKDEKYEEFIKEYLKRITYLASCLKIGKLPKIQELKDDNI